MQVKKKSKNTYVKNVMGFECSKLEAMERKPTLRQLNILREIIKISKWKNMETFTSRRQTYMWINYTLLFSNLKWMHLSRVTLSKDITALIQIGLIEVYENNKNGISQIFFYITEKANDINTAK